MCVTHFGRTRVDSLSPVYFANFGRWLSPSVRKQSASAAIFNVSILGTDISKGFKGSRFKIEKRFEEAVTAVRAIRPYPRSRVGGEYNKCLHISSLQNPLHQYIIAIVGYRFFGGHIAFQCFVPLSLLGATPIALQCFMHICDKSASVILQWSSTILTVSCIFNMYIAVSQNCVWNVPRCSGRMERRGFVTGLVPDLWSVMKYRLYIYSIYIYDYICVYCTHTYIDGHAHALPFAAKTLGFVRDVLSHLFIFDAIAWQCISDGEIPHGRGLFVLLLYICLCPHGRGVLVSHGRDEISSPKKARWAITSETFHSPSWVWIRGESLGLELPDQRQYVNVFPTNRSRN